MISVAFSCVITLKFRDGKHICVSDILSVLSANRFAIDSTSETPFCECFARIAGGGRAFSLIKNYILLTSKARRLKFMTVASKAHLQFTLISVSLAALRNRPLKACRGRARYERVHRRINIDRETLYNFCLRAYDRNLLIRPF